MLLFVYSVIAVSFFVFLSVITLDEMSLLNVMVVCGLSVMWPITIILIIARWNELRGEDK